MANRQFNRKVDIGDVSVEGRQANGMTADDKGNVFIYSGIKDTELQDLTQQNYQGDIPFYYGNSYMAVIKSKTHDNLKLGNNKWDLDQKDDLDPNKITQPTKTNTNECDKEFDDIAEQFLNWENDNQNLGWGPYGSNISPFEAAKTNLKSNYWEINKGKYFTNNKVALTKYIKDLPPGLRSMATQFAYNAGQWHTRLLVTANSLDSNLGITVKQSMNIDSIDPKLSDEANKIFANGSAYMREPSTGLITSIIVKKSETIAQQARADLFIKQYDQIINLYTNSTDIFLTTLKSETDRFYKALVQGNKDSNLYIVDNPTSVGGRQVETRWLPNSEGGQSENLQSFYTEYVNKAFKLATKYKACLKSISQTTTPTVPVTKPKPDETTELIPVKAIIMGDSLSPSFKANSKKLQPLSKEGVLWKVGITVQQLYKFIQNYTEDKSITHIFISIGTNDTYVEFKKTPIKNFITILKQKFPNAAKSIYIIKGLYGYAGIQDGGKDYFGNPISDIKTKITNYYNIWTSLGAIPLKAEVGEVTRHPDPGYPSSMKTIGQEIDGIINSAKPIEVKTEASSNTGITTTVVEETAPDKPAPIVEESSSEGNDGLEYLPEEDSFSQTSVILTDDKGPRHGEVSEEEDKEYYSELNKLIITSTEEILDNKDLESIKQNLSTDLIAYMNHNQGAAGIQTVLYYTFKEPSNKIPLNLFIDNKKKIKVKKLDINNNMYGKNLYPNTKGVGNVGAKDFKQRFGNNTDTSYTPANFLRWWIIYWSTRKKEYSKYGKNLDSLFQKASTYYNVPFEQIKLTSFVESGLVPSAGNANYKGLFAISPAYFNSFWNVKKNDKDFLKKAGLEGKKLDNIYDAELNTWAGVALLVEELKNAQKFIDLYTK
jgi:hypothetical protein